MPNPSLEDVVRLLGDLPGKQLLTAREVALPHWSMKIKSRIQDKKDLPALEEFVLRSMDSGLRRLDEIKSFLGVSGDIVEHTMANLYNRGLIQGIRSVDKDVSLLDYVLTEKGTQTSIALSESVARTVDLDFSYDGLTHEFGMISDSERLRPRDIQPAGLMEIPPFPSDAPDVGPADTPKLQSAYAFTEAANRGAELLKVLGVEGKRSRFYIKAVALVFTSRDNANEHSVVFAIDGRRSLPHERAFEEAEGLKKLGIIDSLRRNNDPALGIVQETILRLRTDDEQRESLRRSALRLRQQTNAAAMALPESGEVPAPLLERYDSLSHELEATEEKLDGDVVRLIDVTEHPHYLHRALSETVNRLLIVSPWLRSNVIDPTFLTHLRRLLQNGVEVKIAYGIGPEGKENSLDKLGREVFNEIDRDFENFTIARLGDTHAKVLISDERFVIVTSFNWLSFKGDPDRPFRDERGTFVSIPSEVSRLYDEYSERIQSRV